MTGNEYYQAPENDGEELETQWAERFQDGPMCERVAEGIFFGIRDGADMEAFGTRGRDKLIEKLAEVLEEYVSAKDFDRLVWAYADRDREMPPRLEDWLNGTADNG